MIICLIVKKQKDVKNCYADSFFLTKIILGGILHAYNKTVK